MMRKQMKFSQPDLKTLQKYLNSEKEILVGIAVQKDLTIGSTERISSKPINFIPDLISFLTNQSIASGVYNSGEVSNGLQINTDFSNIRELGAVLKDIEKGQQVLELIAINADTPFKLSNQNLIDLKMLDFSLGTLKSICHGLQTEKDNQGKSAETEIIAITTAGIRCFHQAIHACIAEQATGRG